MTWLQSRTREAILAHEMRLWRLLRDGLRETPGVVLYCQDSDADRIPVLAFNIEGLEAAHTGALLDADHDVAARTGLHCAPRVHEALGTDRIGGAVRFVPGPFSNEDEMCAAVEAVRRIAAARFRSRSRRSPRPTAHRAAPSEHSPRRGLVA